MIELDWYDENLKTFIIELKKQIASCVSVIESPSAKAIERIDRKDDHINNLKRMIEHRCFSDLGKNVFEDKKFIQLIQGINTVAGGLEKIGDYTVSVAHQTTYFADSTFFKDNYDYKLFFEIVENGLDKVHEALFSQNIETGVLICKSEVLLDYIYESKLKEIIANLQSSTSHASNLVTSLFIFHYLERMGDTLLNIGESIVSAAMGENLKIDQVHSLKENLGFDYYEELKVNEVKFRSIWGTRSGCRIGSVQDKEGEIDTIYKDGDAKKLEKEKENIEKWNNLFPGLAPRVLKFEKNGPIATTLLERIYGSTIKEAVINGNRDQMDKITPVFQETQRRIWEKTFVKEPIHAGFISQLYSRLPDIYVTHSELKDKGHRVGAIKAPSFEKALKNLAEIEKDIPAPFSVLGHGDFNIDNVIYNEEKGTIHYIDLHRSKQNDYAQDTSVCLISCFRLPIFKKKIRKMINETMANQYNFAVQFAQENNDHTFHYRLGLGLVRSFTTSTRFELNKEFAKEMFLRSNYLVNALLDHAKEPQDFIVPLEILQYEK